MVHMASNLCIEGRIRLGDQLIGLNDAPVMGWPLAKIIEEVQKLPRGVGNSGAQVRALRNCKDLVPSPASLTVPFICGGYYVTGEARILDTAGVCRPARLPGPGRGTLRSASARLREKQLSCCGGTAELRGA